MGKLIVITLIVLLIGAGAYGLYLRHQAATKQAPTTNERVLQFYPLKGTVVSLTGNDLTISYQASASAPMQLQKATLTSTTSIFRAVATQEHMSVLTVARTQLIKGSIVVIYAGEPLPVDHAVPLLKIQFIK